jgi:hypothetical protein
MNRRTVLQRIPGVAVLATNWAALSRAAEPDPSPTTVYELRVYHAAEGKLQALLARFREHTTKLFEKHGMKNVAYWVPTDEPAHSNMLIYILEHSSREAATKSWDAFRNDPEWVSVRDKSEVNGKLAEKVDSTFMALTDFSREIG